MPFHLPPLSRRQFITRTMAGLFLCHPLLSDNKPLDSSSWALLADTHIDADPSRIVRNAPMAAHLEKVGTELIALSTRPAGVLINGDCAYLDGQKGDYTTLSKLLKPIQEAGMPIHLTLGNHDDRDHFREGMSEAKTAKHPMLEKHVSVIRAEHANWFLLDTLDEVNVTPGLLGEKQLAWLATALDSNTDKPAIVFGHHYLQRGEVTNGLKDSEALLQVIKRRRHVKAYIFGHSHNWNVTQEESGLHMINLPPVSYVFNEANPSGWVHATLHPNGIRLELRSLDPSHRDHGQRRDLEWRT